MSAIFGLLYRDGRRQAASDLERMDRAVAGFGPDGSGRWIGGAIGLGSRLMHFTPEDRFEQQPCIGGEGHLILVHDGRIDNRPELAHMLGISAMDAKMLPDSAFVLRAYEKWGQDCPSRLVGSFTFALWDARRSELFAARSPFGGSLLFYHDDAACFAFSSRSVGLFALPWVFRSIDPNYLADYLVHLPPESGGSFYQGLRVLEPGHSLFASSGATTLYEFWSPDRLSEVRFSSDGEYVEAARSLFERIITDYSRSLTPISVMMSGGLDSAFVAATAASQRATAGQELMTWTEVPRSGGLAPVVQPGGYADETPFVRAMEDFYPNLRPQFVHGDGFYLDHIEPLFAAAEQPFRNASNRNWWEACLRGSASQGARVVLTGDGGNLTLGWSGDALLTNLMRSGHWWAAYRAARQKVDSGNARSVLRALAGGGLALLPLDLRRLIKRVRRGGSWWPGAERWRYYSPISTELARSTRLAERSADKGYNFDFVWKSDSRATRAMTLKHTQKGANLGSGYRQLFGVDLRNPAYDQRLVEFSLMVPEDQFLHQGIPRALLRRTMSGRVPPEIVNNSLRGVQNSHWLHCLHQAQGLIEEELALLKRSSLATCALDLPRLSELARQLPKISAESPSAQLEYRGFFEHGLMTGRFLRWTESPLEICPSMSLSLL